MVEFLEDGFPQITSSLNLMLFILKRATDTFNIFEPLIISIRLKDFTI